MMTSRLQTICIVAASSILIVRPAMAYLDPSTGNFILQSLIAAGFGAYLFFKMDMRALRERIQGWLGISKPGADSESTDASKD